MQASFVDLRKKSAEIIRALARKERITVLYRGKPAAIMEAIGGRVSDDTQKASEHEAFGIWADHDKSTSVEEHMKILRRKRFDDL